MNKNIGVARAFFNTTEKVIEDIVINKDIEYIAVLDYREEGSDKLSELREKFSDYYSNKEDLSEKEIFMLVTETSFLNRLLLVLPKYRNGEELLQLLYISYAAINKGIEALKKNESNEAKQWIK